MKQTIDKYVGGFLVILMMVITLDVLWGVITRYLFGSQADWTEELARFLLVWIGILGAAYASGQKMHLAIDLLKPKLSPDNQIRVTTIIRWCIIIFAAAVMVFGGFRLLLLTQQLGQLSAALRIPMFIVYSIIPISGLLVIYYKLMEFQK